MDELFLLANRIVFAGLVSGDHYSMEKRSEDIQKGILAGQFLYSFQFFPVLAHRLQCFKQCRSGVVQ